MRLLSAVLTASAVAAELILAGCDHPLIPASALSGNQQKVESHAAPPSADLPIVGVDLYVPVAPSLAVAKYDAGRDLNYIKNQLHVGSVGIVWNLFTPSRHSNEIQSTAGTLSPSEVAAIAGEAQKRHLSVQLRPVVEIRQGFKWEGFISPTSEQLWFDSFYRAELPYLLLAQRLHIGEFVVATELSALNTSSQWAGFLAKVRSVYHGIVSYAALGADYLAPVDRLLLPVQLYGVTAYPDARLPDSASVGQLTAFWKKVYGHVPESILARTMIDETGIPAEDGAYAAPWHWQRVAPLNEAVQEHWFTAACNMVAAYHMRGLYFFAMKLTADPQHPPRDSLPAFEGRLGALAIRNCAASFAKTASKNTNRSRPSG